MAKPLQISNNQLGAITKCSTMAVLRYILQREGASEAPALRSGSAGHSTLECFWRGGTKAEAMAVLAAEYQDWAEANIDPEDKYQGRFSWENVSLILGVYLDRYPLKSLPFKVNPDLIEIAFAVPLTKSGDIELIGLIDAGPVEDRRRGALFGVDHKFTGSITSPWFLPQFRMGSQMTGYLWAMREMTPKKIVGMLVNAIQLSKLPGLTNPERKCREHKIPYEDCWADHLTTQLIYVERTPEQLRTWRWDAIDLAKRFLALQEEYPTVEDLCRVPQEGKFNGSCTMCDYADFCYAGRPADRLATMTKQREARAEWRV